MSSRPTALIYSPRFFPQYVGGGERLAQLTAMGLVANGAAVSVVTTGATAAEYVFEGTRVEVLPEEPAAFRRAFERVIARLAPSFVHMVGSCTAHAAAVAAGRAGVALGVAGLDYGQVCDNHRLVRGNSRVCAGPRSAADCFKCGLERERPRDRWLGQAGRFVPTRLHPALRKSASALLGRETGRQLSWHDQFTRRAASRRQAAEGLDVFVAPSKFAADLTRPHLPPGTRCAQLMYPVAEELFKHEPKRTFRDRLTVGFVGRVLRMKGLHVLLDAASRVSPGLPLEVRIEAATNHDEERDYWWPLKKRAEAMSHVRWCERGVLNSEALRGLHAELDVLAVPSLWPEYVGFVALEAMALGTSVILSDFPSQRDLLDGQDGGEIVPAGDPAALAAALERAWLKKLAGRLPVPATPAIPEREYGRRLLAIYQELGDTRT